MQFGNTYQDQQHRLVLQPLHVGILHHIRSVYIAEHFRQALHNAIAIIIIVYY